VRTRAGIAISCIAIMLVLLAGQSSWAQADPSAAAAPAAQTGGSSIEDSSNDLNVGVGKTVLVDTAQPIKRLAVGLGDIAQASAVSPTEIMVNGKAAGQTSLILWDVKGGRQFFNVNVRAGSAQNNDNLDAVRRELRTELPGQTLKLSVANGNIFLRGTVKDLDSAKRAMEIASAAGKVINLLDVQVPSSDPQILLKVRFASVDLSRLKAMGINLFNLGAGNFLGGVSTGQFSPPTLSNSQVSGGLSGSLGEATISNDLNILGFYPGLGLGATIQALESDGVVQELAQPNIVAENGKEASFLAGGEFPYPVVQATTGAAAITIMFKEYGIRLNFIPTITPRGSIRLQVAPEVSTLDYVHAVEVEGFNVPGLSTRKVNTELELKDGQSFVIGGLLDQEEQKTFEKIPFLGDIPILGKFFQSQSVNKTNTELIVIVTPEIVAPIPAGQPLPELKYPIAHLPFGTDIPVNEPDAKTAENTPAPAPTVIPIETLEDSLKPESPLYIESGTGVFGTASMIPVTGSSTSTSTPSQ